MLIEELAMLAAITVVALLAVPVLILCFTS